MNGLCEELSPGSGYLLEIIKVTCDVVSLVFTTLGITSNATNTVVSGEESLQNFAEIYKDLLGWLSFDDFQLQLLKVFIFVLISNIALIYIAWHIYGARISERFMKPATSAAIEELKKSVSRLKLPKEHSQRI